MKLWILAFAPFVVACASTQPLETASGRPEATISADKTTVKSELLNRAVNARWQVIRETDSTVVVQKANPDFLSNFLLASAWDSQTEVRVTYTLISVGQNTRVLADSSIVTNSGTGYERINEITNNKANEGMRLELENLKTYVEYHAKKPS